MVEENKDIVDKKKAIKSFDPKKYVDFEPTLQLTVEDIELLDLAKNDQFEIFSSRLPEEYASFSDIFYDIYKEAADDSLNEKIQVLSYSDRLHRAQTMRRFAKKIEMARARARLRRASPEKIRERAHKRALQILRSKISKSKDYSLLSSGEKISIDKRLQLIPQLVIDRIALKQIPVVKRAESEKFQKMSHHKESVDDLFEQRFFKRPHELFKKDGTVKLDRRFKMFNKDPITEEDVNELINVVESTNLDRAKTNIDREKFTDKLRHRQSIAAAKRADLKTEDIAGMIERERDHKELTKALRDFGDRLKKSKSENEQDIQTFASDIIDRHEIDGFNPKDLVKLYTRIKNAKQYRKSYDAVDTND
jgi:hypothetical protein